MQRLLSHAVRVGKKLGCCEALKFNLAKLLEDPKLLTSRCKVLGLELERNGWYFLMQTP